MGYPTTTQDSLPDGWPAFPGGCWLPAGSQRKVSGHPLLLSQASPGALILSACRGPVRVPHAHICGVPFLVVERRDLVLYQPSLQPAADRSLTFAARIQT